MVTVNAPDTFDAPPGTLSGFGTGFSLTLEVIKLLQEHSGASLAKAGIVGKLKRSPNKSEADKIVMI
ncbi:MAG: hypothetical protein AAFS12_13060 [Cyanobacteria bacterium J06632_19]